MCRASLALLSAVLLNVPQTAKGGPEAISPASRVQNSGFLPVVARILDAGEVLAMGLGSGEYEAPQVSSAEGTSSAPMNADSAGNPFPPDDAPSTTGGLCDVDQDGTVTVTDVQRIINEALGTIAVADDLNQSGTVNVADVQIVINAVLGAGCTVNSFEPVIVSAVPNSAQQGQTFTIIVTGSNTNFVQNQTQVDLGLGVTINYIIVTGATSLSVQVSVAATANPGVRTLTVTTGQQTATLAGALTVVSASTPAITSILPVIGQQGQSLSITIGGQNIAFAAGQTQVSMERGSRFRVFPWQMQRRC